MNKIGLIRLHSSLSEGDPSLDDEASSFLESLQVSKEISFVAPSEDALPVFLVQTGGSEIFFEKIHASQKEPYLILATGTRNSLAASLEIMSFLERGGKTAKLLHGAPETIGRELIRCAKAFASKRRFGASRLGVIGEPSDWLIASSVDPKEAKKRFGIELVDIPMKEYLLAYQDAPKGDMGLLNRFSSEATNEKDLHASLRIHEALKKIVAGHSLDGFTLRCFDLLQLEHETSCLSFGVFNEQGITAGCEGDVPALLSMQLFRSVTGQSSFMCNPASIDPEKREAVFAHCTCPFDMLRDYRLTTHFESGEGIGIKGEFVEKEVTLLKISPDLRHLRALRGRIVENLSEQNLCRSQIRVRFDEDIEDLLSHPYGNHVIIGYGDHVSELNDTFALFGD